MFRNRDTASESRVMRVLRRLLRFMFWVTLVLGLPYAIWAIYNCFDEVETAQARHWGAPYSNVVPDKANAWLYLLGIGAAENDDPIAMGRRRLDAFETRRRMDPVPPAGVAEQAGPLPHIGPDRAVDGVNHLCDVRKTDCVAWTAQHAVMLDRLATANRVRLLRYETMLSMPHWDEKATPDTVSLDADFKIAFLHLDLLASGWRGGEDPQQVVAALAKTVSFWRRVAEQSHELLSKILAARLIEHGQRILGSIVERLSVAQLRSMQGDLDAILAPQTAMQADLEMVAKEEYLRFAAGTERDLRVGTILRECVAGNVKDRAGAPEGIGRCAIRVLVLPGYVRQATLNLRAEHATVMAACLSMPPEQFKTDCPPMRSAAFEAGLAPVLRHPKGRLSENWGYFAYNLVGRILVVMSVPDLSRYKDRLHDQDAVRRMLAIKLRALQARLPATAMPGFLADQPRELRNPYTGEPFGWEGEDITYAPADSQYWKSERLAIQCRLR